MRQYRIAQYLTPEQKQRAIMARQGSERCPLALALETVSNMPAPTVIATRITTDPETEAGPVRARYEWIRNAVGEFVDDWDRGRIAASELAEALGLTETHAPVGQTSARPALGSGGTGRLRRSRQPAGTSTSG